MPAKLVGKEGGRVILEVTVEAGQVQATREAVFRQLAKSVPVPGFRLGKAPRSVLERRLGEEAVRDEIIEALVAQSYPQAVEELKLTPVADPHVEPGPLSASGPFSYTATVEVYPTVSLGDYNKFQIETRIPRVTGDMVEQEILRLRQERSTYTPVDRPAGNTDLVVVKVGEGSTLPIYLYRATEKVVDALVGARAGEEREVPWEGERQLKVQVESVQAQVLPEVRAVAQELKFANEQALEADLRAKLDAEAAQMGRRLQLSEFVSKLVESMKADLPEALVKRRMAQRLAEISSELKEQQVSYEAYRQYLASRGELEHFESKLHKDSTDWVKVDLALEALVDAEHIALSDAEFQKGLEEMATARRMTVIALRAKLGQEGLDSLRFLLRRDKTMNAVLDRLLAEKPPSLIVPPDALAPGRP
ncbi:MAG: trigger factor [Deinococcus sp.]|nr:trigger factor [Deinococcus sp.]